MFSNNYFHLFFLFMLQILFLTGCETTELINENPKSSPVPITDNIHKNDQPTKLLAQQAPVSDSPVVQSSPSEKSIPEPTDIVSIIKKLDDEGEKRVLDLLHSLYGENRLGNMALKYLTDDSLFRTKTLFSNDPFKIIYVHGTQSLDLEAELYTTPSFSIPHTYLIVADNPRIYILDDLSSSHWLDIGVGLYLGRENSHSFEIIDNEGKLQDFFIKKRKY